MRTRKFWLTSVAAGFFLVILLAACNNDPKTPVITDPGDLTDIPYHPTPYTIVKPPHFPEVPVPADNPMTAEGVQLGRRLFYDPILSGDSTQSCSSCHMPQGSFTDNKSVSKGIDGLLGRRSAMSLLNVAYVKNSASSDGLFWNGRAKSLEDQSLKPVEDPIEMHNTWANAIAKIKEREDYKTRFRQAFGIANTSEITKELAAKAIAQFERILISSGTSKFDKYQEGDIFALDDEELDGKIMYFDEGLANGLQLPDAECFHCHGGITLTGNQFFNNGLDSIDNLADFKDKGRGEFTGNEWDNGKFRVPTLRNIAMSAPYMHDGRFNSLDEVLNHYIAGGKPSPNKDPFIHRLGFKNTQGGTTTYYGFTPYHKQALLKFLNALTDSTFVNNPDIQNPY